MRTVTCGPLPVDAGTVAIMHPSDIEPISQLIIEFVDRGCEANVIVLYSRALGTLSRRVPAALIMSKPLGSAVGQWHGAISVFPESPSPPPSSPPSYLPPCLPPSLAPSPICSQNEHDLKRLHS